MLLKLTALLGATILALSVYHITHPTPVEDVRALWATWKSQYGAVYTNQADDDYRFSVFQYQYNIIKEHNAKKSSYTMGLNKFSNLTPSEFKEQYTSGWAIDPEAPGDPYCPSAVNCTDFPTTTSLALNWTAEGAVTHVNNNGPNCGASWAFASAEALEALWFLNTSNLVSFSAQQLVDCTGNLGCQGCDGCWPYLAFDYTAKKGIEPSADYPYAGQQQNCNYNSADSVAVNTGFRCVAQKNITEMVNAVGQQPVAIGVMASSAAFQNYQSGVLDSGSECGPETDHAALITGYTTINNTEAWIVKNSWGTSWGDNGYIYIGMATANDGFGVCGIYRCGTIPVNGTA